MRARIACLLALSALFAAEAARAECNCLYNGQRYEQEDEVCMRTPQGMRMARCGMLDNIAWWEILDRPCQGTVSELPAGQSAPALTPPAGSSERRDAASSM